MYQIRSDETRVNHIYGRTDRIAMSDDGLYYRTREGELRGPFKTESRALFDLNIFIEVTQIEKQIQDDFNLQLAWG